jgi:dTDP-L-rhamnose 4-epimerase
VSIVLITGGAGFIGSTVANAALARGLQVRILDSIRADVHGAPPQIDSQIEFIEGDVRDRVACDAALQGVDVVSHQAAKVGLGVDFSDSPDYVSSNALGTAVLLAAMTAAKVSRIVLASSMVVYGEGRYRGPHGIARPSPRREVDLRAGRFDPLDDEGHPLTPELITEDAEADPRNVYAVTKLAQEQLVSAWCRSTGGRAAALRYHNVYGSGMPQNTPYAGVASLFRSAIERGEAPRVFEDGLQRRDFVNVRDVASANVAALDWTATVDPGQFRAFNVGSGDIRTIGQLAAVLSENAGAPAPVVTGEYRLGDVRHITASSARLRSELGWAPSISFEEGLREFATAPLRAAVTRR